MLLAVSIFGLYLWVRALGKDPATIKGIRLTITGQYVFAVLLQFPLLIYVYLGYYTGVL